MSTLHYKEFQGSVEFEDSVLVIRILHIDDLVTTEVDSASRAQVAFEELIDDYLVTCAELGKEPCRPFRGSFNVRVTPELHRQVSMAAAEAGESMNSWVSQALEARIETQTSKKTSLHGLRPWITHQRSGEGQYLHTAFLKKASDPNSFKRQLPIYAGGNRRK
jgi:predicted HicB family RNase H-like nuclease